jgi:hypothetical protein
MTQPAANKSLTLIKLMAYWLLCLLFSYAWYTQYYQWIDCFNELGRCFNPNDSVVYTDSSFVWVIPAAIFLGLSIITLFNLLNKR